MNPYVRNVDVDWVAIDQYLTQADTFAAKPVTVLNAMNVSIHRPGVKQCGHNRIF